MKSILAIVILSLLSCAIKAADNVNIKITGKVVASPCIPNGGSDALNVDFGDIQATSLQEAGSSSTPVDFALNFSDCPAGTTSVMATFTGTPDPDAGVKYYKNSGSAKNIAVQLIQTTTGYPKGNGDSITQSVQSDRTVSMAMKAKAYSSAGEAMPGTINAVIVATLQYN